MRSRHSTTRHPLGLLAAATLLLLPAAARSATSAKPGEAKHVGWEVSLAPPGETGGAFEIEGRVLSGESSQPIRDLLVHVYHADARGKYSRPGETQPRLSGLLRTNVLGGFRVRTVLPGLAEGIPHVHFQIALPGPEYRVLALNLCRREGAGSDTAFARLPQMLSLPNGGNWVYVHRDTSGVFHCTWDLALARTVRIHERPEAFTPGH